MNRESSTLYRADINRQKPTVSILLKGRIPRETWLPEANKRLVVGHPAASGAWEALLVRGETVESF